MAEGIQLSFQLQSVLQKDKTLIIRGYRYNIRIHHLFSYKINLIFVFQNCK